MKKEAVYFSETLILLLLDYEAFYHVVYLLQNHNLHVSCLDLVNRFRVCAVSPSHPPSAAMDAQLIQLYHNNTSRELECTLTILALMDTYHGFASHPL
jgi:hypothetical protein